MQVMGIAASASHAHFPHPAGKTRGDTPLPRANEALDRILRTRLSDFM